MSSIKELRRCGANMVPLEEFRNVSGVQAIGCGPRDWREDRTLLWWLEVAVTRRVPSRWRRACGSSVLRALSKASLSLNGQYEVRGGCRGGSKFEKDWQIGIGGIARGRGSKIQKGREKVEWRGSWGGIFEIGR